MKQSRSSRSRVEKTVPKPPPTGPKTPSTLAATVAAGKSFETTERCGTCSACLREDCGQCEGCVCKQKYGGDGSSKKQCVYRGCQAISEINLKVGGGCFASATHNSDISSVLPTSQYPPYPFTPPPSLIDVNKKRKPDLTIADKKSMYGKLIPSESPRDHCSGCNLRQETINDSVLICDGPACGREYHLRCCVPALDIIPEGDWLCQDCSPSGSAETLMQYLESNDERRCDFQSSEEFVASLISHDMVKEKVHRRPLSELERATEIHRSAIGENWNLLISPDFYVGKPLRIYDGLANQYHSGRLVDCRQSLSCGTVEYLARFPSGKDGRKSPLHHWIILEEHCLAIGTALIWSQTLGRRWKPAQLLLRTGRELVSVASMYSEEQGEIRFTDSKHTLNALPSTPETDTINPAATPCSGSASRSAPSEPRFPIKKRRRNEVWGLVRFFGEGTFEFVPLTARARSYKDPIFQAKYGKSEAIWLPLAIAEAEQAEQTSVLQWRNMEQNNRLSQHVLSSRDDYGLQPLQPTNSFDSVSFPSQLTPSIPQGLDRLHILNLLQEQGLEVDKDIASILQCTSVPVNVARCLKQNGHVV